MVNQANKGSPPPTAKTNTSNTNDATTTTTNTNRYHHQHIAGNATATNNTTTNTTDTTTATIPYQRKWSCIMRSPPKNLFSPVEGFRENATPVPQSLFMLPYTMAWLGCRSSQPQTRIGCHLRRGTKQDKFPSKCYRMELEGSESQAGHVARKTTVLKNLLRSSIVKLFREHLVENTKYRISARGRLSRSRAKHQHEPLVGATFHPTCLRLLVQTGWCVGDSFRHAP